MAYATLTSKGQITIPKSIRETLRLKTGDRVEFLTGGKGEARMLACRHGLADIAGILKSAKGPLPLEAMDQAIAEAAAESAMVRRRRR